MANTGFDWGAWAFALDAGGGNWDADTIADTASITSNTSISMDVIAACEVGVVLVEDNTGAIDGNVTIYVLGDGAGIQDEEITVGTPWAFKVRPVQNDTVVVRFSVDPSMYGSFKIALYNDSGQTLATSVKYRTATIPVAS